MPILQEQKSVTPLLCKKCIFRYARKRPTEIKNMPRPTAYKPEYAEQARKLCLLSAIDKDLADFFSVSERTINTWKKKHADFAQALRDGKIYADAQVAERLFQRATGYAHHEDKIFSYGGEPLIVPTTKYYPPDTTAAIFWLKNRQRAHWRDKQEVDHSGEVRGGVLVVPSTVSPTEWEQAVEDQLAAAEAQANKD